MCEPSVWSATKTDDVITFPIQVTNQATVKADLTAIKHLEIIKNVQKSWVIPGSNKEANKKKIHHNVSATVLVKDEDWPEVIKYFYTNREYFTAVSFLPATGDKIYKQAPNEAITTEDEKKWDEIVKNYKPVNYRDLKEEEDNTKLQQTVICAGNQCELVKL
jgi:ribonucleoside-triphosphate reductase